MTTPTQPPARGGFLGLPPRTALIVLGVAAGGAVLWFWWRNHKAASATAPTSSTGCTDSSGNAVPCPDTSGIDTAGQLSVIQTELESVLAGQAGTTTTGGTTTTATTVAVPNVVGDNWGKADNAIRGIGLVPAISGQSSTAHTNTSRTVTKQSPAAGTQVAKGSTVTVTLSKTTTKTTSGGSSSSGSSGGENENDSGSG